MESLVEVEDFPGRLLHVAALWDNAELLSDLLRGDERACLEARDSWGRTAMHAAATNADSKCLPILVEAGAKCDVACGPRGECRTPLHVSAEHGHAANVRLLVGPAAGGGGALLTARDSQGLTPMDLAEKGDHKDCMQILSEAADRQEAARMEMIKSLKDACVNGDLHGLRSLLSSLPDAVAVANTINHIGGSGGSNTLLFKASEYGHRDLVSFLLESGADGRSHPVTKYSPLYIAAYNGHKEVVELLLARFPGLIDTLTVERWSPLHACCINGHAAIFELLLRFPFKRELLKTFRDKSGKWEYEFAFDINLCDVTGQTPLYLACCVSNAKIVDLLLSLRVKGRRLLPPKASKAVAKGQSRDDQGEKVLSSSAAASITAKKATGIQALISRLRGTNEEELGEDESWINPVLVDSYCNNGTETALHNLVRRREATIASRLLASGANPNLAIYAASSSTSSSPSEVDERSQSASDFYFKGSTCLVEACKNRDLTMIDLLLKYSARDDDCKALQVAAQAGDEIVVSKLLSLKANQDLENSINRKGIAEFNHALVKGFASVGSLAYSSIFPSTPVMINWHRQQGGCLTAVKEQYLVDAAVRLNPKLRLSPKFQFSAVHAITRLDLSNNDLVELPECVWYLQSLKVLNLSQNKLESLPSSVHRKIGLSSLRSTRSSLYNCPMLEEVLLQDNRLETLPAALFALKSLSTLDVSNNKLQHLPFEMWLNPALKELNLSFNLLTELPASRGWKQGDGGSQASSINPGSSLSDVSYDSDEVSMEALSELTDSDGETTSVSSRKSKNDPSKEGSKRLKKLPLKHDSLWSTSLAIVDNAKLAGNAYDDYRTKLGPDGATGGEGTAEDTPKESTLASLNLAHNSFSVVPRCLACLAPNLARLNLAYNSVDKFGPVSCYPNSLKHLDLSYNQINAWPGEASNLTLPDNVCYAPEVTEAEGGALSGVQQLKAQELQQQQSLVENKVLSRIHKLSVTGKSNACAHRSHTKLENLRTLIMSNNLLTNIHYYCSKEEESGVGDQASALDDARSRILFPVVSMFDVSGNNIVVIPDTISDLNNLSVLNVSNNPRITDLPAQMGLLHKLWNLNTKGCNLQEPLLTMSQSKSYKTSDIIGYLRSILENSKPYARLKLMVVGVQGIGKTTLLEMLRQEGGSFKKRTSGSQEHWAKRMGNKNINMKTGRGVSMSTVGVDIGDWTYEKKSVGKSASLGPVVFRTWDFGGQTEYYATHQYFLSRRSLYVVVWRITDGERGMNEIQQWLINIQARAPNSPVIVVGTHVDVVRDEFPPSFSEYLQQRIRDKFIHVTDPEKCGLPRVLETIEVSCKTKHNLRLLANLLYDTAFSLRSPGSKARLLEQKIPASYLALEDLVGVLATDLKSKGKDPVLNQEQYEDMVTLELEKRFSIRFRDTAELNQATKFLHDNGLLLHYEDATLRDLYFLDPQWLCDVLSHVVTVREINPFARSGIMRLDDLRHVFKSSAAVSLSARSYIVNLLNKFEVALTWDSRTLLIPSLLPTEQQMRASPAGDNSARVTVAVRTRGWGWFRGRQRHLAQTGLGSGVGGAAGGSGDAKGARSRSVPSRALAKDLKISKPVEIDIDDKGSKAATKAGGADFEMSKRTEAEHCIHRLLLMSYFPSGFWSRLLTRVLADDSVVEIVRSYFHVPEEMFRDPVLARVFVEQRPEWVCWQTGLELRYMDTTLFSMRQVVPKVQAAYDYSSVRMLLKQDDDWAEVDTKSSSILEVTLPQDTVVIKRPVRAAAASSSSSRTDPAAGGAAAIGYQATVLDPNPRSVCQLLALAVEHIDTLLEDWYPSLGTRFLHTSEGKMLVTRLVPCPRCLAAQQAHHNEVRSWQDWSFLPPGVPRPDQAVLQQPKEHLPVRVSQESAASDRDSGVGQESPRGSQQNRRVRERPRVDEVEEAMEEEKEEDRVHCFLVEDCILFAFRGHNPTCPVHGDLVLGQVAPDTVFLDLEDRLRVSGDSIKLGDLIGRGAFGFVYEAALRQSRGGQQQPYQSLQLQAQQQQQRSVAVKMLQPIDPGAEARNSAVVAFKANQAKWERDPLQYACKAYCSARQELNILIHLRHPHIVPLVGVGCSNPLSIVLELAPMGALDRKLRHYRRSGDRIPAKSVQLVILQIARALEYLHQHHIIYRDLKSENVLVWKLPEPFSPAIHSADVHVKLADYGISRSTLPTGAKGFGGTEGFMAPEIVRYNGEEEYTEKVDSFSFGMFIYELVSLRQPFAGQDAGGVKELVLEGGRPALTPAEAAASPTYVLDLMVSCWAQQPRARPSASQAVSVASAPEFARLVDMASLDDGACSSCVAVHSSNKVGPPSLDLWLSISSAFEDYPQLHILEAGQLGWQDHLVLASSSKDCAPGLTHSVTSMCLVNDSVWMGDNLGYIHSYSADDVHRKLFTYKMEPDELEDASPVRSLHFLPELQRACVAMHNGRMFLCCADVVPAAQEGMEGTFLVTELGSATCIHSVTSVVRKGKSRGASPTAEIWCGESHGAVSVFTLMEGVVTSQEVVNHNDPVVENLEVLQVVSAADDGEWGGQTPDAVWTFVYPGCHIYQWKTGEQGQRVIRSKLDCSKLVPSSESLRTISAIDEHFTSSSSSSSRCQISCMCVQRGKLYAGTSWGCLVVADAATMRPVSVFRPYSQEIQAIIPMNSNGFMAANAKPKKSSSKQKTDSKSEDQSTRPLLVTLGRGYRSLIDRFIVGARSKKKQLLLRPNSRKKSAASVRDEDDDGDDEEEENARTMTALLWRPDDWLAD